MNLKMAFKTNDADSVLIKPFSRKPITLGFYNTIEKATSSVRDICSWNKPITIFFIIVKC